MGIAPWRSPSPYGADPAGVSATRLRRQATPARYECRIVGAAEAAESVGARAGESAFWRMHDLIFEHQQNSDRALDDEHLVWYAKQAGADPRRVAEDLLDDAFADRVKEDFLSGVRSGVNGTPTFFINGQRYDGPWYDVDLLETALREVAEGVRVGR